MTSPQKGPSLDPFSVDPPRLEQVREIVRPDDFHADAHRRIFGHLLEMRNGGNGAIDSTLLLDRLRESDDIEAVGGADGGAAANIAEMIHQTAMVSNVVHYAGIVKGHAERRAVIHAATDILQAAYNGVTPAVLRKRLESCARKDGRRQRDRLCADDPSGAYGP